MRGVELVEALKRKGVVTREQVARWESVSGLLAVLDAMGKDGATALVKVDGARAAGLVYTVLVSGGRLAHDVVFRKDGADLPPLLREAIAFYEGEVWSKDGERSVGKEGGRLKW